MNGRVCFCFCFALTIEELKKDLDRPKDFVSNNFASSGKSIEEFWNMFHRQIVKPYNTLKRQYKRYPEFHFMEKVKFEDYQDALNCTEFETVILYSHCKDGGLESEKIEFYDRLVESGAVAAMIPFERSMDLDFSICEPILLRTTLDSTPDKQFVTISWEEKVDLEMGLRLYYLIFEAIRRNPKLSYSRSFTEVLGSFHKIGNYAIQ
jgi:hypothetical protein